MVVAGEELVSILPLGLYLLGECLDKVRKECYLMVTSLILKNEGGVVIRTHRFNCDKPTIGLLIAKVFKRG